jgi:hypothetical protein
MPLGRRACFWVATAARSSSWTRRPNSLVAYVMNKMESGLVGDLRGATVALTAAIAAAA